VNPNVNTSFNVPGLAGMTSAETAGMIILVIFVVCVALGMIVLGVANSRQKARRDERHLTYDDFRSIDRQYNRTGNRPISDSGFGANRSARIVQDPAGYWRTAQSFEAPIGVARVQHREPMRQMLQQRQLAIASRPVSPGTGYRIDPRQPRILGLQPVFMIPENSLHVGDQVHLVASGQLPAPVSPPMYPVSPAPQPMPVSEPVNVGVRWVPEVVTPTYAPMTHDEFDSIVPTSPPVPSARHYRPAVAPDHYTPITYAPIDPTAGFNPLGQEFKPQAEVSIGRHSRVGDAPGTESQRHWTMATGQLDVTELRQLLAVG
jgi:hypothetical protein